MVAIIIDIFVVLKVMYMRGVSEAIERIFCKTSLEKSGGSASALDNIKGKTTISSLFVLKGICAFIVVMLHTPSILQERLSPFVPWGYIAVPIFCMISGYFLYDADDERMASRAWKALQKIFIATLILNIVYFIPFLLKWENPLYNPKRVAIWLLKGGVLARHMWYMPAMLYSLLIIYASCKLRIRKWLALTLLLMPIGALLNRYGFLWGNSERMYSDFNVWAALPYLVLGITLRRWEAPLLRLNWELITWVSLALSILEVYIAGALAEGKGVYLSRYLLTPVLASALFMWAKQYPSFGSGSLLAHVGERYSAGIYYWHMLVVFAIEALISHLGISFFYYGIGSLYVFCISLLIAWLLASLQRRLGIQWI